MNKTERLHEMIRYLDQKEIFNLKDIMLTFNISKSTALRDIASLEAIGLPFYAEYGRHGSYKILRNTLISPIIFTLDEIYALYFAMLTLEVYETTPFHMSYNKLNKKFEENLSEKQLLKINKMKDSLSFNITKHHTESKFLDVIFSSILAQESCNFSYQRKKNEIKSYHIQFFKITARYGQWYASGLEISTNKFKTFRCDKIVNLQKSEVSTEVSQIEFNRNYLQHYIEPDAIHFTVEINEDAKSLFFKEQYPSMKLNGNSIEGFYNKGEEKFIADYFIQYGTGILSIDSTNLKQEIQNRLQEISSHFHKI